MVDLDARGRIHRYAGMVHRAIDRVEQSLASKSQGVISSQAKYGQQLRESVGARPLQSVGMALGAGMVLDKVFASKPQVRVVRVPVPASRGLGKARQEVAQEVGATAGLGVAAAKAIGASLARMASTLPPQVRLATERLLSRSQAYGSMAASQVRQHPLAGAGAVAGVAALGALLSRMRARPAPGTPYVTVDEQGNGLAWERDRPDVRLRTSAAISSRPVLSAVVLLGVGALVGSMLKRQ
jgi:ElaB/YqjD/DUF883 family membrane-anchored ribosome-binding protein